MSAWAASAATIPLTVIAMLTTPSTTRRGRRAATRSPSSSGTGSRAEIAISQAVRRGGRAESASARTVLVRAARTAGTKVAATATRECDGGHEADGGQRERCAHRRCRGGRRWDR